MSRRTFTAHAGLAAVLAALAATAPPAMAAKKVTCTSGSTLLASKDARVFKATKNGILRVYACKTGSTKPRYIGKVGGESVDPKSLTLTGKYLAYTIRPCSEDACRASLLVKNIATGKEVSVSTATPDLPDVEDAVSAIVLSNKGHVAWIAEKHNDSGVATARYVLAKGDGTGVGKPAVILGSGLDIEPTSLALGGGTVYWTQAALAKSAPLP